MKRLFSLLVVTSLLGAPLAGSCQADNTCPIQILKNWLANDAIGTPTIRIYYKNISSKDIDAITFSVSCFNNFNEPVNGSLDGNKFQGISQTTLRAGKKEESTWTMYSFDLTTKTDTPLITKVHFTDGSKWEYQTPAGTK